MATNYISIVEFGAVSDGKTDNTAAIQKALDAAASSGMAVYIPAGTFRHTGVLKANGVDIFGDGQSSVLYAAGTKQMLQLSGDGASLKNVALDSNATERSPGTAEEAKLHVFEATNFEISGVTIKNSMSAGILVRASSEGWIHDNNVSSTGSDGMRMTKGSHDIRIEKNTVSHAGDDSIAVITSASQAFTQNIEIVDNKVYDNDWGRGISVVGGAHVKIVNNLVDGNLANRAGIYIASETDYNTKGVEDVVVQGNTVLDTGSSTTQPSILVYNGTGLAMTGISINDNKVVPPTNTKAFSIRGTADVNAHDNGPDVTPVRYTVNPWTGTTVDSPTPAPTPAPTPMPSEPTGDLPVVTTPFSGTVQSVAETGTVFGSGDVADDAAIWVNPTDPTKSFIVGESKASKGGLHVFDLAGREVSKFATNSPIGNVDVHGDVVAAANRGTNAVDLFKIDATGKLTKLGSFATGMPDVYGFALGKAADGKLYAFVSSQTGLVRQFDVKVDGSVSATAVRDIKRGAITEGMTVDDANGAVYIAEEDKGVYKYSLDPMTGQTNKTVDTVGRHGIVADLEGNAIYDAGGGKGYFVVSSQGNNELKVYDRQTDSYLGTFKVDGVTGTDGMDISSANMGGAFGKGVLVVHDDSTSLTTSNYKIVPWDSIQKLIGTVETATTTSTLTSAPTSTLSPTPTTEATATFSIASFTGTDASELIVGNALDNTIFGRGGHDTIYGGAGNDRIEGNSGDDVLHGGTGNDIFIVGSSLALHETILDFTQGQDKFDLGERDANTATSGLQDFVFIGNQSFTKAGQLRAYQDAAEGITIIEGNTDGNSTAEMQIECKGLIAFQASDFIL